MSGPSTRAAALAPVVEQLAAELSGSELQSLLLEVLRRRAAGRAPAELLGQIQRDLFVCPSPVDLREALAIDAQLLAAAADFEAVELSPVAPLGACSGLALTHQDRVLSALRNSEVVADPTNVLALLTALRLRAAPRAPVHLTTCQRVLRAQPVPRLHGYSQHFRIFVLASGGQEAQGHGFTVSALLQHVRVMLDALDRLERQGYAFGRRGVSVLATPERAALGDRVAEGLGAIASRDLLEHPYYSGGLRYQIRVTAPDGTELPLIDGGSFDWLARLCSNRRAVYVASGTGAQLIAARFRAPSATAG